MFNPPGDPIFHAESEQNDPTKFPGTEEGNKDAMEGLYAEIRYAPPQVHMVPLHEVEEIATPDWYLELLNFLAAAVIGAAISQIANQFPQWFWFTLAVIMGVAVIGYHYRRKFNQTKKKQLLKSRAVAIDKRFFEDVE